MDSLKKLSVEHDDVFKRLQLFEKASLDCFENKKNLSKKEYLKIVTPCRTLFKTGLVAHFKHEEMAVFPILLGKSKMVAQTIRNLISDHSMMMNKFSEFESIEDYDLSIQVLSDLMKLLSNHAEKEEDFFSSIQLSNDEIIKIDEVAKALGF